MAFNLQAFLQDMDRRQTAAHEDLVRRFDQLGDKQADLAARQETFNARLLLVERTHSLIRWAAGTAIVAALTALFAEGASVVRRVLFG